MRIEEQPARDRPVSAEEVEENAGPVYVSVRDAGWERYAPQLPEDAVPMVAAPIVVDSAPVAPAAEPTLHFASAELDPTLVPAFLAPAPVSPAPVEPAATVARAARSGPEGIDSVTAAGPLGRRRRRRTRAGDRTPRR